MKNGIVTDDTRLLKCLTAEERASCRLLTQYPLYRYAARPGQLDVLLLGHGPMVKRMLCDAAWCGQMPGWQLMIRTVHASDEAAKAFADELCREMPMLPRFSDLGRAPEKVYVRFDLAVLPELTAKTAVARFPESRWILIDLGDEEKSRTLAFEMALEMADADAVILYAGEADGGCVSGMAKLVPCFLVDERAQRTTERLARLAADIDWFYTRRRNPFASREKQREAFASGKDAEYTQHSSLPPALFGYKLASMGIDPDAPAAQIAREYTVRVLDDPEGYDQLVYGEHRRWLMNKVMSGFYLPTKEELREQCFTLERHRFNSGKLHNCMVTSDASCQRLWTLNREDWDRFADWEAIDKTALDELDKVSLKCHLLAREMLQESLEHREERLRRLRVLIERGQTMDARQRMVYQSFCAWLHELTNTGREYRAADQQLAALRSLLDMEDPQARRLYQELHREADLAFEYHRCHDYKAGDRDMVEQLPWLYCRPDRLVLIKLTSRYMIDNIAPALLLEPDLAIYLDIPDTKPLTDFFKERGDNVQLRFDDASLGIQDTLNRLLDEYGSDAVIDLTGASDLQTAQAVLIAMQRGAGLIHCDSETQRVVNVLNFPLADVVRKQLSLRADEVFRLYGGQARPSFSDARGVSVHELRDTVRKLWEFYSKPEGHKCWKVFAEEVHRRISSRHTNLFSVTQDIAKKARLPKQAWHCYQGSIPADKAENSNLVGVMLELQHQERLVRDFDFAIEGNEMAISFQYPELLRKHFQLFFDNIRRTAAPLLALQSSSNYISVTDMHNLTFSCTRAAADKEGFRETADFLIGAGLMEECQGELPENMDYAYTFANPSMVLCASSIGGLLEAYTAICALDLLDIDDVRLGYTVHWREDGEACNELDIVAVSGLRMVLLSCKDTQPKSSDVIEVAYIASSFSCNSRAMIVTTHEFERENDKQVFAERAYVSGVRVAGRDAVFNGKLRDEIHAALTLGDRES